MHPRPNRGPEPARLRVLVVDVVLATDTVTRELEQPAHRIAKHHSSAVADVQRPRRVDAPELHLHALPAAEVRRAVVLATQGNLGDQPLQPLRVQCEVRIAARGHGGRGSVRHHNRLRDPSRDLRRRLAQDPPVAGACRPPELQVGQVALDTQRAHRLDERLADAAADASPRAFSGQQDGCAPASVNSTWVEVLPRV